MNNCPICDMPIGTALSCPYGWNRPKQWLTSLDFDEDFKTKYVSLMRAVVKLMNGKDYRTLTMQEAYLLGTMESIGIARTNYGFVKAWMDDNV